jgi:hypothetical protein
MKIELKNVKTSAAMSQESQAFTADVWVNGIKSGHVENQGTGGISMITPPALHNKIEEYTKTLPPIQAYGMDIPVNADFFISNILEKQLRSKKLTSLLKKYIVFRKSNAPINKRIYTIKTRPTNTEGIIILNDIPFEEALELFTLP